MALPVFLGRALQAVGRAGNVFGPQMNPMAGQKGLPVARPVQADWQKAANGMMNLGNTITQVGFAAQIGGQAIGGLVGLLQKMPTAPIRAFTAVMNAVQAPVLYAVDAIRGFRNSITAIGNSISEFVQLASPVEVQKFKLASDDLTASIGKALVPVMRFATALTRGFADVLFRLSGPFERIMAKFFDPLTEAIPKLVNAAEPLIDLFGLLAEVFTGMPGIINFTVSAVSMFASMLESFGLTKGGLSGSSVGAAVRPAQIGSIEDYGRRAQQAAFSLGTGADPARDSANSLRDIYNWLTGIESYIKNLPANIGTALGEAIVAKLGPRNATELAQSGKGAEWALLRTFGINL